MNNNLEKYLFLFSLVALFFLYGYMSHSLKIFPHQVFEEAQIAYKALTELYEEESQQKEEQIFPGMDFWDESGITAPQANTFSDQAGSEYLFIVGNDKTYRDLSPNGCVAWICDRNGKVIHAWKRHPNLWKSLKNESIGGNWYVYPVGGILYPNGDILISYQGANMFPISVGMAKFDLSSNILWKSEGFYHHWGSVDKTGKIYIPSKRVVKSPFRVPDHLKVFTCEKKYFSIDNIAVLDKGGQLVKEIDLLQAFVESDLTGVFHDAGSTRNVLHTCDPMHLNDVRILQEDRSRHFSRFSAGDLLLSFRSINGVGVLDPETERFKWFYVGAVHNQHSPRFFKDNCVIVFDNMGGRESRGTSRIVSINTMDGTTETLFPPSNSNSPSHGFFSKNAGRVDIHPGNRRMLICWTHKGLIWEVDMQSGEVLWEYINTHPLQKKYGRISVCTATYVDNADFIFNYGKIH